jgi:hypothetical protein
MGLDPELVREAERAKEHLAVSQHAAYRAKVDYHQAIRRLHAAGGSLREIAETLGLSHQRVHQIIEEAAEPTRWRWRRRRQVMHGPPGPCSFCGRSHQECAQLIAGPGVFICERSVAQATRLSASTPGPGWAEGPLRLEASQSEAGCSFCGKTPGRGCAWSPADCRGRRPASSATTLGSAMSVWTCAWTSWPRPHRSESVPWIFASATWLGGAQRGRQARQESC